MSGYQDLVVYQLATTIYDLTTVFCQHYIDKKSRTYDQMIQAGRSGKQNIVEASLEKSLKSNIKLNGVARGSFGELLEDFKDYLRQRNLKLWTKEDHRVTYIRSVREFPNKTYLTNRSNLTNSPYSNYHNNSEDFANLMIVLLHKENYLVDQLIKALERKFISEGGYTENLFKKRLINRSKLD